MLTWPDNGLATVGGGAIQCTTPPPSIIPMLRATIGADTGNGAMYLHRWELST